MTGHTLRIALVALLATLMAAAGCTPWHVRQGFDDRSEMNTPEGQARLVEIVAGGGNDARRAAMQLTEADAEVIRPVMPQLILYYSEHCRIDHFFESDPVRDGGCPHVEQTALKFGAEAVPALQGVNAYAAAVGLGALGLEGRSGISTLITGLGHEDPLIRKRSIDALRQIGVAEPRALEILSVLSGADGDAEVKEAARRAHRSLQSGVTPEEADALAAATAPPQDVTQREEPSPRPEPGEVVGQPRPNDIALIIGIEDYRGDIPDSTGARKDAEVFADLAETHLGLSRRNIIVLLDQQATRSSLEAYFEEWLPRNAREDGRVFVYFAGHGAPDPQTGESYLVPWDGDPRFITRQGIHIDNLTASLRELPAAEVVLMMDSCFSGSGGRSVLAEGTRPLVPVQDIAVAEEPGEARFSLLAAASSDEVTGMTADGEHGLFSYYLFEGIRGAADRDQDGRVSLGELADFIAGHVPDEARRDNRDQTPVSHFIPDTTVDIDLVVFD